MLSHAEQRRQKKRQKKDHAVSDEKDASTDQKSAKVKNTAEIAPSSIPKRQNSVWVGNLAFKTTPVSLRQFFNGVGEITRIHMPMKLASAGPGGKGAMKENRGLVHRFCQRFISILCLHDSEFIDSHMWISPRLMLRP